VDEEYHLKSIVRGGTGGKPGTTSAVGGKKVCRTESRSGAGEKRAPFKRGVIGLRHLRDLSLIGDQSSEEWARLLGPSVIYKYPTQKVGGLRGRCESICSEFLFK